MSGKLKFDIKMKNKSETFDKSRINKENLLSYGSPKKKVDQLFENIPGLNNIQEYSGLEEFLEI